MEEIKTKMSAIEDPRHQSYVKYALADILIIIMCAVLCGLDTLGDLVIYAKSREEFLVKERYHPGPTQMAWIAVCFSLLSGL